MFPTFPFGFWEFEHHWNIKDFRLLGAAYGQRHGQRLLDPEPNPTPDLACPAPFREHGPALSRSLPISVAFDGSEMPGFVRSRHRESDVAEIENHDVAWFDVPARWFFRPCRTVLPQAP